MKTALLLIAVAVVALAQMSDAAPQPFSLSKVVKKVGHTVGHAVGGRAKCLVHSGVPKSLAKKALACSPTALGGVGTFATCAGLASISDAKKALSCFG